MKLSDALNVQPGDIVAFVGAGGKTSALFRLATELVDRGLHVITTTTTRMANSERLLAPVSLTIDRFEELGTALSTTHHVFVYHRSDAEQGKVLGIDPERVADLADLAEVVLIEADGARRLPLKGPFPHEPVIPDSATLVVPVAGLDAVGEPLDDAHVYGVENIRRHLDVSQSPNVVVGGRLLGSVLAHKQLGLKDLPDGARVAVLLNKYSSQIETAVEQAASVALTAPRIDRVLIGAVQQPDPVRCVRRRVGAVVLAAGLSRRMGEPKVLLPWGQSTIVREIVQTIVETGLFAETLVVTGQWDDAIRQQIDGLPVRPVHNPRFAEGEMISSVQVGLEHLSSSVGAALILLGDQPGLQPAIMKEVLDAYARMLSPIVAPVYQGQRGHPVLFDRVLWDEILALPDGAAPRDVLRAHSQEIVQVAVETKTILQDIDTPQDYDRERPG
jgi:molybdenum cofactor cytidylyltransferase